MAESEKLKSLLMKVKDRSKKVGLKLNIQKNNIMASLSHHFMANRRGGSGNSEKLFLWAPKSQQMVTAAMKLKMLALWKKSYDQLHFSSFAQSCLTFVTPCIIAHQASPSNTNSRSLLKLMSIESVMSSSHLILCRPLLLLPPIPTRIRVFSNESTLCMRWPKYWSFSFSISPSNEHPGLISFRMDWLDLKGL